MSISGRLLQIGGWVGVSGALLAGCAGSKPPVSASPSPPVTAAPAPDGRIRIGPSEPSPENAEAPLAAGPGRAEVAAFARDLADREQLPLDRVMGSLSVAHYNATVARLIAPAPPDHKIWRSWLTYRSRFVEPKRIRWGVDFWRENAALLDQASQRYGVPASIIAAIIGVETIYGRNMGDFRVLDALATLAFDYPVPDKPERVELFRNQLGDFIGLALRGKLDLETRGSYAGAIGMPQFMPGSIMRYAVDGDGDGHIDLANSKADAIMSVGNFLAQHGWQRGVPVFAPVALPPSAATLVAGGLEPTLDWPSLQAAGAQALSDGANASWRSQPLGVVDLVEEARGTAQYRTGTANFFVITKYNRSYFYAASVSDLADELAAGVGSVLASRTGR